MQCFLSIWLQTHLKTFAPVETCNKMLVMWILGKKNIVLATETFCIVQLKSTALQLSADLLQWNLSVRVGYGYGSLCIAFFIEVIVFFSFLFQNAACVVVAARNASASTVRVCTYRSQTDFTGVLLMGIWEVKSLTSILFF